MNMIPQFLKPQPVPEMPQVGDFHQPELSESLADEAMAVVGFHDAMRAQNLAELRQFRERLAHNIERETEALAEVDAMIARDEYAAVHAVPKPAPAPAKRGKGREAANG